MCWKLLSGFKLCAISDAQKHSKKFHLSRRCSLKLKNIKGKNTLRKLHEVEDVKEITQHISKECKHLKICQVAGGSK